MQNRRAHAWLFATAAIALTGGQAAFAADAETAESAPASASTATEVVVTAQRRSQNLQKAPVAVTAISAQSLAQANIATTQDLMQIVPSLQVAAQTAADSGGSATFFLRGMGQQRSGNGSGPAVGVYVDDFYYPSLEGDVFDIVDLADVEVLRGPQGTLFGRNTIGGAIRYTSQQPALGAFSGHATATYGSYNRGDFTGVLNIPIGGDAAVRVTAGHLERDGFVKVQSGGPDAGATNTNLLRVQVKFEPTSSFTANLSTMWDRFQLKGFTYDLPGPLTPVPGPTLPFAYNRFVAPALGLPLYTNALESKCFYCQPGPSSPEFSKTEYENALGTLNWELTPWLTIKSLTGWQHVATSFSADLDGTPLPIIDTGTTKQSTNVWSQEFQFNGRTLGERLNFVTGLFYYNETDPGVIQETPPIILAAPGIIVPSENRGTETYAAYADLTYKLTDQLNLIGGYRISADHKTDTVLGARLAEFSKTFTSDTWRAGVQYQWTPTIMTYFTASTGYRSGGFNPYQAAANGVVPFAPETNISYEAGARLQFLDRKLTLNPTVFYEDWSKIQVQSVYFPPRSAIGVVVLQNAGAAEGKGVELEWNYAVLPGLHLFGTLATLDLHYSNIGTATGITLHSPLERAPKLTYSLGGSYTYGLSAAGDLTGSLNYSYEGRQNSTPTDADTLILPAYSLLNGRIEWTELHRHYSIALFGTNLTNSRYYVGGTNFYANVGAAQYDVGRPQEFGVTVRANF